jgi:hypothetical protein
MVLRAGLLGSLGLLKGGVGERGSRHHRERRGESKEESWQAREKAGKIEERGEKERGALREQPECMQHVELGLLGLWYDPSACSTLPPCTSTGANIHLKGKRGKGERV